MMDLGIMMVAYFLLPLSSIANLLLLFPFPQFMKKKVRAYFSSYLLGLLLFSILAFGFYLYSYSTTNFLVEESDPVEYRLEAKAKIWKMERNYHITFFNLVNWCVLSGTDRLLGRLDAKTKKHSN